jgi:hypothetical protein
MAAPAVLNVLLAGSVGADPIGSYTMAFSIDGLGVGGSMSEVVDPDVTGDTGYYHLDDVTLGGVAFVDYWNSSFDIDPFVTNNFNVTNISAFTQTFDIVVTSPVVPTGPQTLMTGSIGLSVTNTASGGAALSDDGVVAVYQALIDGSTEQTLFDPALRAGLLLRLRQRRVHQRARAGSELDHFRPDPLHAVTGRQRLRYERLQHRGGARADDCPVARARPRRPGRHGAPPLIALPVETQGAWPNGQALCVFGTGRLRARARASPCSNFARLRLAARSVRARTDEESDRSGSSPATRAYTRTQRAHRPAPRQGRTLSPGSHGGGMPCPDDGSAQRRPRCCPWCCSRRRLPAQTRAHSGRRWSWS